MQILFALEFHEKSCHCTRGVVVLRFDVIIIFMYYVRQDVHKCYSQKEAPTEGISHAHEAGVPSAALDLGRKHSEKESYSKDCENESYL